jgi:Flp pilus assembly protein TadG
MQNFLHRLRKNQDGAVAVIAVLLLAVLLGFSAFVLDFGVSYYEAGKLQNALDSVVLAAVQELPANNTSSSRWTAAKNEAITYAALNKLSITEGDIHPIYQDDETTNQIIGITITKSANVEYNFAKLFGVNSGTVNRTATAGLTGVGGVSGAIPLSISTSSLNNAIAAGAVTNLTIKCSSNANDIGIDCTGVSGWFGALRFDGSGASVYSNLLAYGYSGTLYVGQVLDMESGNMSGPTLDGFTTRYNECKDGCKASDYEPDCPRLVYIPVVQVLSSKQVKIEAFAAFFLTECGGNGNNSYIKATYVDNVVLPDTSPGKNGLDFGLYVGKLLG